LCRERSRNYELIANKIMQENKFDIHISPKGHEARFLNKLDSRVLNKKKKTKSKTLWVAIAAGLALLISLWFNFVNYKTSYELADVSPKYKETQLFFTTSIQREIKQINEQKNESNKEIINTTLKRVTQLEEEYQSLMVELQESGFNKRVVNAMIFNFQQRIEILKELVGFLEITSQTQNKQLT